MEKTFLVGFHYFWKRKFVVFKHKFSNPSFFSHKLLNKLSCRTFVNGVDDILCNLHGSLQKPNIQSFCFFFGSKWRIHNHNITNFITKLGIIINLYLNKIHKFLKLIIIDILLCSG